MRPDGRAGLWLAVLREPIALGLALFVVLRPWRDGLTFPSFNAYYIAIVVALAALYGARMLVRGEPLRFPTPIGLLAAFLLIAYLTGFRTIEYNLSHHGLHHQATFLLLFFVCCNALRSRVAVGIVLSAVVTSWLFSGTWAVLHYYHSLPDLREVLQGNAGLLEHYFGTSQLTPELKNRLEMNRAFGTFLFPNALGAFLILAIPFLASALRPSWSALGEAHLAAAPVNRTAQRAEAPWRTWVVVASTGAAFLAVLLTVYAVNEFLGEASPRGARPVESTLGLIVLYAFVPIATGAIVFAVTWRHGFHVLGQGMRMTGVTLALLVCGFALWLSYSRGAIIALSVGSLIAVALYLIGNRRSRVLALGGHAAAIAVAGVAWVSVAAAPHAGAQEMVEPGLRPSPIQYPRAKIAQERRALQTINVAGIERQFEDLGDLSSFRLRVTYWQVGLLMFKDHFWTGVGLGNFKTAYPRYQFLGAGDVEIAHNDFLQAFTETGVFGGLAFSAFWIYFVVWGAQRILRTIDGRHRALLAGLYAGVLAFVVHSLVDFNFANPGLASLAYILAGVFYAASRFDDTTPADASKRGALVTRLAAVPLLGLVAITTGSVLRVFLFDYALTEEQGLWRLYSVGDRSGMDRQLDTAVFFLRTVPKMPLNQRKPPYTGFRAAGDFIGDTALLETIGTIGVPLASDPTKVRRVTAGEPVPSNALLFVVNRKLARTAAIDAAVRRVAVLEQWDESYPHDAQLALHLYNWYGLLYNSVDRPADKKRYALSVLKWARKAVDRSPEVAWFRSSYAKALWLRGTLEKGPARLDYYDRGLEEYANAKDLYPISSAMWTQYGSALIQLGQALVDARRVDRGQKMLEEGEAAKQRGRLLARYPTLSRALNRPWPKSS